MEMIEVDWKCSLLPYDPTHWYQVAYQIFSEDPGNIKAFLCIDQDHGYVLQYAIIDSKLPLASHITYDLNDPRGRYRKDDYNFTYEPENAVPKSWSWKNSRADEDLVLCGDGTEDHCLGWYYEARYGQYLLFISFRDNMSYKDFQRFVVAINDEFVSNLH